MSKMKKILGILLAVCFLLSVTAASASACDTNNCKEKKVVYKFKDVKKYKEEVKHKEVNKHKEVKKIWKKGCYEKKPVKCFQKMKVGMKYMQVVVYKYIMIWMPGCWKIC